MKFTYHCYWRFKVPRDLIKSDISYQYLTTYNNLENDLTASEPAHPIKSQRRHKRGHISGNYYKNEKQYRAMNGPSSNRIL